MRTLIARVAEIASQTSVSVACVLVLSCWATPAAGVESVVRRHTVFQSGEGGYHTYRIPAIVATNSGTLLAFCEGRKAGRSDAGDIDVLVARSTDNGKTWSAPRVVWDDGANTCGNPTAVVDRTTGVVWLAMTWNRGDDQEHEIMEGVSDDFRRPYLARSEDEGRTWTRPTDLSDSVRQPHWRWYAFGPGNGIQLTRGPHAGRLVLPANHSDHSDPDAHPYRSHVVFSDDHGASWRLGAVHEDRTNESAVVELSDGGIRQLMRSYHGENARAVAVSRDGGATFGPLRLDKALNTPVCQASVLRLTWPSDDDPTARSRVVFASPRGERRHRFSLWMSYDDGQTWPVTHEVDSGSAAYSCLVALPDLHIGVLYERGDYHAIEFLVAPVGALEQNR